MKSLFTASLQPRAKSTWFSRSLNKKYKGKLETIDFEKIALSTIKIIDEFNTSYQKIISHPDTPKEKLILLKKIIEKTNKYRSQGTKKYSAFFYKNPTLTHGDFSVINVLITEEDKVFVVDWDNLAIRPITYELQNALSLFSSKYKGNAYIVEPDFERLKLFLDSYLQVNPLSKRELQLLPLIAEYNFAFYWLSYTIPPILKYDFRFLDLIPEDISKALYWTKNLKKYQDFIDNY